MALANVGPLGDPHAMVDEIRGTPPRPRLIHGPAILDEAEADAIFGLTIRRSQYLQAWWIPGHDGLPQALLMPMLLDPEWPQ